MTRADARLGLLLYDAAVRAQRSGDCAQALRFTASARRFLGFDVASPHSLAFGGVR